MTTVARLAGMLAVIASVSLAARQQPTSQPGQELVPATALILGRTVDFASGGGVSGAIVTLAPTGGPNGPAGRGAAQGTAALRFPMRVICDAEGHFLFHDLPKGSYSVTATKPGYGDTTYGRRSPSDTTSSLLVLADGERKSDVTLVMWKLASMAGTVVDEAGEPVVGMPVTLLRRSFIGGRPRFVQAGSPYFTDDRGIYRARSLAPGDYVAAILTTETTVPLAWQSATTAALRDDARLSRELDRSPEAMSALFQSGQRVGGLSVTADGGYNVAEPPIVGGRIFVYQTTFYPSSLTPSKATLISVSSGEDRTGVDFQVRPAPTARISGSITGPDGPAGGVGMELINAMTEEADRDPFFAVADCVSDASGAFTFLGVPAGNYVIRVQRNPARPDQNLNGTTVIQTPNGTITTGIGAGATGSVTEEPTLWAQMPVSVTGPDVTGLSLALREGLRLSGRVEFVGSRPQPTPAQIALVGIDIQAAAGRNQASLTINGGFSGFARGSVDANLQFKTFQLPPGRFVIRATLPVPGWTFASAMFRGRDVADSPIDLGGDDLTDIVITFTDKVSELTGSVHAGQGVDATASVLIFPADAANWMDYGPAARRLRLVRPSSDGTYRTQLLAGDYLVTAIHSPVPSTWTDPEFLKKLAETATRVSIVSGTNKVQDLRSTEVR